MVKEKYLKFKFYVLLFVCLMCFGYSSIKCIEKITSFDTTVELQVRSTNEATFPAMTICPGYDDAFNKTFANRFNTTVGLIRKGRYPKGIGSSRDFFNEVTTSFNTLVESIHVETLASLPNTTFREFLFTTDLVNNDFNNEVQSITRVSQLTENEDLVETQMFRAFGRCYTFRMPQELVAIKVHSMIFTLKMAGLVYPHHPGQFQDKDTKNKLPVDLNRFYFAPSTHKLFNSLPIPIASGNFDSTCSESMTWTYDECIYKAIEDKLRQKYGCVVPYYNRYNAKDVCQVQDFSAEKSQEILNFFEANLDEHVRTETCNRPCTTMDLTSGHVIPDNTHSRNQLKMYFSSQVKIQKSRYTYDIINFLGEIGGYVGLLLGVSVLNLDRVIDSLIRMFQNSQKLNSH